MTDRDLMQQALEALNHVNVQDRVQIIAALRERLAQPEQEPVAWEEVLGAIARGWTHEDNKHKTMDVPLAVAIAKEVQDMIAAQQPREWVGLTEEDLVECDEAEYKAARYWEAKLKEKNA